MADTAEQRYELAEKLAREITIRAEELSTAIYEASKYGYHAKVKLSNAHPIGNGVFIGHGNTSLVVNATITFDIGERGL